MIAVNGVLGSPRWTTIYRCVKHPKHEVVMNSVDPPDEERTFRVPGVGNSLFVPVAITKLNEPDGGFKRMAKTKRKKKTRSKKKKEEATEELEGLEGLDDDLEELDEDEPDEVDEDDTDDEDADDESDDSDDDEDDEDEEPKRKRKKKSSSKSKSKSKRTPPTRELPKGKYGAAEIAEIAGVDARAVRLFLRKKANKKLYPKDSELGRYSFTKKDATKIAKAIKRGSTKDEDDDE